jgi:hypothetical protein
MKEICWCWTEGGAELLAGRSPEMRDGSCKRFSDSLEGRPSATHHRRQILMEKKHGGRATCIGKDICHWQWSSSGNEVGEVHGHVQGNGIFHQKVKRSGNHP